MKKGDEFTHKSFVRDEMVDTNHGKTRRRVKAKMKITSIRKGCVYYTYADSESNKGAWYLPIADFEETYGG